MKLPKLALVSALILSLLPGCTGTHFDITREIGLLPPRLEERSDFYDAAEGRCKQYNKGTASAECIQYWEATLWAQDYRSYARARAILNRNVIYLGGVVALVSVGALAGFSALGHTNSDAFKIIPIAGAFISGLLGYSKNDALYEAYEVAGMKIDQTLRLAESTAGTQTTGDYSASAAMIRREVGAAVDELTHKRIDIVKFQSKSESEQFNEIQAASMERELASFSLTTIASNEASNPTAIIATLNSAPDSQKLSAGELRLRLTDVASGNVDTLRLSSMEGATMKADIPTDLRDHGLRKFIVEVQARNGNYTLRGAKDLTLSFEKVRFDLDVKGQGSVKYTDWENTAVTCSEKKACPTQKVLRDKDTLLMATALATGKLPHWSSPSCNTDLTCTIKPAADMKVSVEFK